MFAQLASSAHGGARGPRAAVGNDTDTLANVASSEPAAPTPHADMRGSSRRLDVLLVLLALAALGPFVQLLSAQPASRYALTAALWDNHTVGLDRYENVLGVDRIVVNGELRSDKAPGQPFAAIPPYAAYRIFGGEPATELRISGNLGLWGVTVWSAVIPFAVLLVLMRRVAARVGMRFATHASLAIGFGTILAAYGTQLYGHVAAATIGFAAWHLVRDKDIPSFRLVVAGFCAAAAVAIEYPAVIVVGITISYVAVTIRRRVGWFALGTIFPLAFLGIYQWSALGSPFRVPYSAKAWHRVGIAGVGLPRFDAVVSILLGDRGLMRLSPVVLLAVAASLFLLIRSGPARVDALVALVVFLGFLIVQSGGVDPPYGGESTGPRYMIPALPFMAAPLAAVWHRIPRIAASVALVGALVMVLPLITPYMVAESDRLFAVWLARLRAGDLTPTIWTISFGWAGWLLHATLVAIAATALARQDRRSRSFGLVGASVPFDRA